MWLLDNYVGTFKNEVTCLPASENWIHILGMYFKALSQSLKPISEVAFIISHYKLAHNHRHLVLSTISSNYK